MQSSITVMTIVVERFGCLKTMASGIPQRTIIFRIVTGRLIVSWQRSRNQAKNKTMPILTNSEGWICTGPSFSHRTAPLWLMPRMRTRPRSPMQIP